MKRLCVGVLGLGTIIVFAAAALSQGPPPKDKGPGKPGEPPPRRPDGPPGGPPPRFELGRVLPPHLRDELDLTDEQEKQLDELEKEVKERLLKILTAEQKKKLRDLRRTPPPPPPPPPGGPGRPPAKESGREPGGPPPAPPPPRPDDRE
jgi:hypothetical protein